MIETIIHCDRCGDSSDTATNFVRVMVMQIGSEPQSYDFCHECAKQVDYFLGQTDHKDYPGSTVGSDTTT